jgi:hypothetical protein
MSDLLKDLTTFDLVKSDGSFSCHHFSNANNWFRINTNIPGSV